MLVLGHVAIGVVNIMVADQAGGAFEAFEGVAAIGHLREPVWAQGVAVGITQQIYHAGAARDDLRSANKSSIQLLQEIAHANPHQFLAKNLIESNKQNKESSISLLIFLTLYSTNTCISVSLFTP